MPLQDNPVDSTKQLTATATVRVTVTDSDDLPPRFTYTGCTPVVEGVCLNPQYTGVATVGQTGEIAVQPATIRAVDGDTLGYDVR